MNTLILDCDLMRFRNTGLYHYCLNLGHYINILLQEQQQETMKFYIPPREIGSFDDPGNCIVEKPIHKYVKPFLMGCKLWHAPFQSGRMVPQNHKSIKVLLTIHDLNPLHEDLPAEERKRSIAHTQKLIHRANAIVCISEFCKADVLENCEVGNKPIYVIHNGTHAVGSPMLSNGSYKPRRPFLFAMGDMNRKKNFHTLLPLLEYTHLELVIAGRLAEPDYVQGIQAQAKEKAVEEQLHILGPVSENEKAWYFQNCEAYVHPSLAEGFGAPVVEAMSFGKPLFLSHLTSLPEIGGEVAFYFESFDPVHMNHVLLEGMRHYRQNGMEQKIIRRSQEFDWKIKSKEYLAVYQTLVQ